MKRNITALGQRTCHGDYHRILCAGALTLDECTAAKVYAAGDIEARRTRAGKLHAAGALKADACTFGMVKTAGEMRLIGVCTADTACITGHLNADLLECTVLHNGFKRPRRVDVEVKETTLENAETGEDGAQSKPEKRVSYSFTINRTRVRHAFSVSGKHLISGRVQAKTFESTIPVALNADYRFDTIVSYAPLESDKEIACENFYSAGLLRTPGVNAERVYLMSCAHSEVGAVTGTHVTVSSRFRPDGPLRAAPSFMRHRRRKGDGTIHIASIEADSIEIDHAHVEYVSGADVRLKAGAQVDRLEYTRSISIEKNAQVKELVKL